MELGLLVEVIDRITKELSKNSLSSSAERARGRREFLLSLGFTVNNS